MAIITCFFGLDWIELNDKHFESKMSGSLSYVKRERFELMTFCTQQTKLKHLNSLLFYLFSQ